MKYPSMGSNSRNAVSVPALSGGVNLSDALNLVDDNQMTDCKNVWYKDGVLKTRPGIKSTQQYRDVMTEDYSPPNYANNMVEIDGVDYKIAVYGVKGSPYLKILFFPENIDLSQNAYVDDFCKYAIWNFPSGVPFESFVFYNGKSTYPRGKGVYMLATVSEYTVELYELATTNTTDSGYEFGLVTADYLYQPLVYVNGKGEGFADLPNDGNSFAPASFFEGRNAFPGAWSRYCYTTDSVSSIYRIPDDIDNVYFSISYTDTTGRWYSSLVYRVEGGQLKAYAEDNKGTKPNIDSNNNGELTATDNKKLYFWVNKSTNSFIFLDGSKAAAPLDNALGKTTNNLIFRIRPITPSKSILAGATKSNKFGGVSEGIYGGTRTFLTGFSGENKNLLVWSDLNNPTYFSENAYNHIGSASKQITALAKQDDMLVIYKEKELFYATYVTGENYTAEDVLAG